MLHYYFLYQSSLTKFLYIYIKHLMTGPEGNSLSCFLLKNLNVSRGGAEENIEKFIKLPCNGSHQSTFTRGVGDHCATVQCYDVKSKILQHCPPRDFGRKQFHC